MKIELGGQYLATSPDGQRVHRIHCADVFRPGVLRSMLAGETLAAVAADPPYCSGGILPSARRSPSKGPNSTPYEGDARSDPAYLEWSRTWLSDLHALAGPECYAFVWTDWRQVGQVGLAIEMSGWHRRGLGVWDKTEASRLPHKGYLRHQAELVVWGTAGALRARRDPAQPVVSGVFRCPVDRQKIHQHQKPVAVWRWLLEILADRPGVILDPFAGSCSSVLAGNALGRVVVAADRSPAILGAAFERLRAEGFRIVEAGSGSDPREAFLRHLEAGRTVELAAELAGRSRSWAYWLADNDNDFARRWDAVRRRA